MKTIDVLNLLTGYAKSYRAIAIKSIKQNSHMNECNLDISMYQEDVDALLVDFINYIGSCNCVDYALYTSDIKKDK